MSATPFNVRSVVFFAAALGFATVTACPARAQGLGGLGTFFEQAGNALEGATGIEVPEIQTPQIQLPDPRQWTKIDTNRDEVRANLRRGWQTPTAAVVFGQELDHDRQQNMAGAIAASIASGNAGPAMAYLKVLAYEQRNVFINNSRGEFQRVATEMSQMFLENAFQDALNGNFRTYQFRNAEVQVGFAAYNHWKRVVVDYPEWKGGRIVWSRSDRRFSLPNTHQPYVRVRLIVNQQLPPVAIQRVPWQSFNYGNGHFVKAGPIWREFQNGRHLVDFREVGRTAEFVDLFDPGRQMTVRLYSNKVFWKQPQTGWNFIYNGVAR